MRRFHYKPSQGYRKEPQLPYVWLNRWLPPQGFDSGVLGPDFEAYSDVSAEFENIGGIAIDTNNRIITVDSDNKLAYVFDSDQTLLFTFDGTAGGGTAFVDPRDVAVDSNNRIIVSDQGSSLVQIYDSDGIYTGTQITFLTAPLGVATDSNDRIIVTYPNTPIVRVYDSAGTFLFSLTGGLLGVPTSVTTDTNDRIIVGEVGRVEIYSSTGMFVSSFNGTNGGTGFNKVEDVESDSNDRIIVTSEFIDIVQIFDSSGVFVSSFDGMVGGGTGFVEPFGLGINTNNDIFVGDTDHEIIQKFDSAGIYQELVLTGIDSGLIEFTDAMDSGIVIVREG